MGTTIGALQGKSDEIVCEPVTLKTQIKLYELPEIVNMIIVSWVYAKVLKPQDRISMMY